MSVLRSIDQICRRATIMLRRTHSASYYLDIHQGVLRSIELMHLPARNLLRWTQSRDSIHITRSPLHNRKKGRCALRGKPEFTASQWRFCDEQPLSTSVSTAKSVVTASYNKLRHQTTSLYNLLDVRPNSTVIDKKRVTKHWKLTVQAVLQVVYQKMATEKQRRHQKRTFKGNKCRQLIWSKYWKSLRRNSKFHWQTTLG